MLDGCRGEQGRPISDLWTQPASPNTVGAEGQVVRVAAGVYSFPML